jgi:hypothetical protein
MTTPTQPVGIFPQGTHLKELLCAIADMEFQPHRWTPEHPAPTDEGIARLTLAYMEIRALDRQVQEQVKAIFEKHGFGGAPHNFIGGIFVYCANPEDAEFSDQD